MRKYSSWSWKWKYHSRADNVQVCHFKQRHFCCRFSDFTHWFTLDIQLLGYVYFAQFILSVGPYGALQHFWIYFPLLWGFLFTCQFNFCTVTINNEIIPQWLALRKLRPKMLYLQVPFSLQIQTTFVDIFPSNVKIPTLVHRVKLESK